MNNMMMYVVFRKNKGEVSVRDGDGFPVKLKHQTVVEDIVFPEKNIFWKVWGLSRRKPWQFHDINLRVAMLSRVVLK